MSKTYTSAEDVMATINAQTEQALEAMERAEEYRRATQLLRGRGASGGVVVEVDAQGVLVDIEFTGPASVTPPAELARAVTAAYRAALDQVLHRLVLETREAWGDSETTQVVVEDLHARFAPQDVETEAKA